MGGGVTSNGALRLGEVRGAAATALAPAEPSDPPVFASFVDALSPPALLLMWDTPWIEPRSFQSGQTMGRGWWDANLIVLLVAGRLEPGPGVDTLEQLAGYVIGRLQADPHQWPLPTSTPPRSWVVGNVSYLGATLNYRVPVTL